MRMFSSTCVFCDVRIIQIAFDSHPIWFHSPIGGRMPGDVYSFCKTTTAEPSPYEKLLEESRLAKAKRESEVLITRPDLSTPCRCGNPECKWTVIDDDQRDKVEGAQAIIEESEKFSKKE